jgi:hypothetical protein
VAARALRDSTMTNWTIRCNANGYWLVECYSRGNSTPLFRRAFDNKIDAESYLELAGDLSERIKGV